MLALVLPDEPENYEYAERVLSHAHGNGVQLVAPRIITAEITYKLLKHGRHARWGETKTAELAEFLDMVPLRMFTVTSSMAGIVRYAWRHNVQGYDAQYVALADHFKAPIATLDRGLISAARTMNLKLA
jgi:predicted nucleic acid-binding protein